MYRFGIIGLSPGNGHPYSWAAIFNGFDREAMAKCPFPVIPEYLNPQDPETMCIEEGEVTHIWTQDREISEDVAKASHIPVIVAQLTDMIGQVDAVILARDDGEQHLEMAKPFIDAGVPILIDKPLTDQAAHLPAFVRYYQEGRPIMSCSSARYSPAVLAVKERTDLGRILTASAVTPKYWSTYSMHMIEAVYRVMGGGIAAVQNVGRPKEEIVHMEYTDGRHAVIQSFAGIAAGQVTFFGEHDKALVSGGDAFTQFKNMLVHFVRMLDTGQPQFDWRETVEMAKVVIGGQRSLDEGGRRVRLEDIAES